MGTIQHSALSASERHEPKSVTLTASIPDISTANTIYIPIPFAGSITKVTTVLFGAIATGDATITVSDNAANSMGTITVTQSGSAAGDVDSLTPAANQDVTANDFITVATDGASTNSVQLNVVVTLEVT